MPEADDTQLLRDYAERQSEAAFAELVRRHVNLVYSCALRQTGNAHQAEEITQAVFIILARKTASLGRKTILSGWLYQTARLTAANFLRTERRRAFREQEAHMQSLLNDPSTDDAWPRIAPLLDDAMTELGARDRNAVVLRFFNGKSLTEVGAILGVSEDAAKMRIHRALEKLRRFFLRRGATLTTASIAGALTANAVQAAPAALASGVATVAGGGAVVTVSTLTLVKGVLNLVTISKLQLGAISAVVVAGLVTPLVIEHRANVRLRAENLELREQSQQRPEAGASPAVAAPDPDEQERQRRERVELLRLRGEVGRLRAVEQELAKLRATSSQSGRATPPSVTPAVADLPKESWTDAGFATPQAALQTRGWAVLNANRERFKESVLITDGAKKLLEAMLEGMIVGSPDPEKARQQIRENGLSLEDGILFPMIAEHQQKGYAGYRVLSQQSPSAKEAVFEVETAMASGKPKTETLKFQQVNGDWKVVVDEAQVQAEFAKGRK